MAKRSRPAQGNNANRPYNRPRPAYKADAAPVVINAGTLSRPRPVNSGPLRGKRLVPDATPKIVNL